MGETIDRLVVLDHKPHGIPASEYVAALESRLPEVEVDLASLPAEQRRAVADAPVVTSNRFDEDLLTAAEELRLFACTYAGVDHLPLAAFEERGVTVTNAAGVHGPPVAEQVLAWLLSVERGLLDEARRREARREWSHFQAPGELRGSTVTVVGLGAIGTAIVERLEGFGVDTVGVRYTPAKGGPTDEVVGHDEFADVLPRTDHLVLACPLTEETRGLVGEAELGLLPPDAVLVNVARGPVVDTDALVATLRRSGLRAAALDVTDPEPLPEDHPLWTLSDVHITPHVAGYTPHYLERCADILAENVRRVAETGSFEDLRNEV
jgi:phosphoglycerate dehydrogenase-like enzyme